jgi:hypothetical protein
MGAEVYASINFFSFPSGRGWNKRKYIPNNMIIANPK